MAIRPAVSLGATRRAAICTGALRSSLDDAIISTLSALRDAQDAPPASGGRDGRFGLAVPGEAGRSGGRKRLGPVGRPMLRAADDERGMAGSTATSALLHAALLAALLLTIQHLPGGRAKEPPTVDLVYDRAGSSGTAGPPLKTPQDETTESPPPPQAPAAAPAEPPETADAPEPLPAPQIEEPPPAPAPPSQQAMLQAPRTPVPETKPAQHPRPHAAHMTRLRMRPAPSRPTHSTSPFSSPMDLSFADKPATRPSRPRHGTGGIDLALGPMVKNGALSVPYASTSVRGVSDDYSELLQEWIERHMYYPDEAARRNEDGTSGVHVVIDRSGRVLSIQTSERSGSNALDDATSGMFRGAKLPPVPPDMAGPTFPIDLTIHYIIEHEER